jgi:hypothetical protein
MLKNLEIKSSSLARWFPVRFCQKPEMGRDKKVQPDAVQLYSPVFKPGPVTYKQCSLGQVTNSASVSPIKTLCRLNEITLYILYNIYIMYEKCPELSRHSPTSLWSGTSQSMVLHIRI